MYGPDEKNYSRQVKLEFEVNFTAAELNWKLSSEAKLNFCEWAVYKMSILAILLWCPNQWYQRVIYMVDHKINAHLFCLYVCMYV